MVLFEQLLLTTRYKTVIYGMLSCILIGCSSHDPSKVQVDDKSRLYRHNVKVSVVGEQTNQSSNAVQAGRYVQTVKGRHVVQAEETLYSLAFKYGRDWKDIAHINNISAPYTIYPGQVIYFSKNNTTTTSNQPTIVNKDKTPQPQKTNKPSTPPKDKEPPKVVITKPVSGKWGWPASGKVVSKFSSSGTINKGIDIVGKEGSPIVASNSGTVVYAGNNLHGYGELLIIKHNENYVSAYAHNRRLLVKEGQQVKSGQAIAEMGSTGTDRVKLHFEIRKNGKPVDPIKFLPRQ